MFDTHCHLQFSRFKKNVDEVIAAAREAGVEYITIPGTDIPTSQKAVEIAAKNAGIFAAIGIHPHHVYEMHIAKEKFEIETLISQLEPLLTDPKVVAVGEVGLDRHVYENTKYENYNIDETFIDLQKILLKAQIELALKYKKSLIIHNREAKADMLPLLESVWNVQLEGRAVFHCCEPDAQLLQFAKDHEMFIGTDGDLTYFKEKQDFIKTVPLEMLVLETDSPFLLPEPLRSQKLFPNKPQNIGIVAATVARLKNVSEEEVKTLTTANAKSLFQIS